MSDELSDPCRYKNDDAYHPEFVTTDFNEVAKEQAKNREQEHAKGKWYGKFLIVKHHKDQCKNSKVESEFKYDVLYFYRIEQSNNAEENKRYANPVNDLVDAVLMVASVFVEPLLHCFHGVKILKDNNFSEYCYFVIHF